MLLPFYPSVPVENKIVTVTTNTAIDHHIIVDSLSLGANKVAKSSMQFASGKGVNVSKAVESLGCPSIAMGFTGSGSLDFFDGIRSNLLCMDFIAVDGVTRTNITLIDSTTCLETHIRTLGYTVTPSDCEILIDQISSYADSGDIVVLSGSLPAGAPEGFYRDIIELCHEKSAIPFLDASGKGMVLGLKAKPFLIKPNQHEFEQLTGESYSCEKEIVDAAHKFIENGIERVVVSRGPEGALFVDKESAMEVKVVGALSGNPFSSIGCGDTMVAGLAVAKLRGYDLQDAIRLSLSCGVANLYSAEPGRFDPRQLASIADRILVRRL